jgi:hypothetical protein
MTETSTTYPKIETLFDRKEDFSVDTTKLRRPEFGLINQWLVTEKVDGTNIRLIFAGEPSDQGLTYSIAGRTDNSQFDQRLWNMLDELCKKIRPEVGLTMQEHGLEDFVLYGEGYGAKIQSGGWYRDDQGFTLFDVKAGSSWLSDEGVSDTASRLGLNRVPLLAPPGLEEGLPTDRLWWTLHEIIHDVSIGMRSRVAFVEERTMEGIVARPPVPLFDRRGQRVIFKLKGKDFKAGRR